MLINESSDNMLCYCIAKEEKTDAFTLRMLQQARPPWFLVPGNPSGKKGNRMLIPTAGCVRLEDYLQREGTDGAGSAAGKLNALFRQLNEALTAVSSYMIPEEELILEYNLAFVERETGQLKLLCLPVGHASLRSGTLRDFCRCAVAACFAEETGRADERALADRMKRINSPDFSAEDLVREGEPAEVRPASGAAERAVVRKEEPSRTEEPAREEKDAGGKEKREEKQAGFFRRLGRFLAGNQAEDAEEDAGDAASPDPFDDPFADRPGGPGEPARSKGTGKNDRPAFRRAAAKAAQDAQDAQSAAEGHSCVLTVRSSGAMLVLEGKPVVIGSDCTLADLVLPNSPRAAREHCRVFPENGHYRVEDLNTDSGTFKNGTRVRMWEAEILEPADVIRVGSEEIIYAERDDIPEDFGQAKPFSPEI